jgi:Putative auto-transporter adhesin, head GIN domain
MKKIIIIAVSLLTVNAALFAGNSSVSPVTEYTKVISAKAPFYSIVVNNDIDVVLTEATDILIEIKGEEEGVKKVSHYIKKGVLYINSKQGSLKGRATVYVSVNGLQSIEVNGKSTISSKGVLNSSKLKVFVNGEARFDLKNYGQLLIEADEEIDLHFEKWIGLQEVAAITPNNADIKKADAAMDTQMMNVAHSTENI